MYIILENNVINQTFRETGKSVWGEKEVWGPQEDIEGPVLSLFTLFL